MLEIANGRVNLETLSESARKRVTRAKTHGAAVICVPVQVEIKGGSFESVASTDNPRPWDTIGIYEFSIYYRRTSQKGIDEHVFKYRLTGDGRMYRLTAYETGSDVDDKGKFVPRIEWLERGMIRGVDAKVGHTIDSQTGKKEATLSFVAVPEPGQWEGIEGDDKSPGADRKRMRINSGDIPVPILQTLGVVF